MARLGAEGERVGAGFTINGKVVTLISLNPPRLECKSLSTNDK
ncbi:MAG: hypothetical protein RIE73_28700 [Coleofasciculus sp. C1-SOL-03]